MNEPFVVFVDVVESNESKGGYLYLVEYVTLPSGETIQRKDNIIDFSPMEEFIGEQFHMIYSGVKETEACVLKDVYKQDDLDCFEYDIIDTH
jgi:hypothetical protein